MNRDLKDLYKIGLVDGIQSFGPVLLWVLAGVLFGSRYANGFIITYPYQFISSLLYCVMFKGQLKSEVKHRDESHDRAFTGIKALFLAYIMLFVLSAVFGRCILGFLNLSAQDMGTFLFGVSVMFMGWIVNGIVSVKQYDGDNGGAFAIALSWHGGKIIIMAMLGLCGTGPGMTFTVISLFMLVMLFFLFHRHCGQKHFMFSLSDGIKYSLHTISGDMGMIAVYVLGIGKMAGSSAAALGAYNMLSICADTQWDILSSATDTVGTLRVKAGEFIRIRRRLFWNVVIYSVTLFLSIATFISVCSIIPAYRDSIDFNMVWVMFLLECWGFPLYAMRHMMSSWVAIEHPNGYSFFINLLTYATRFVTIICVTGNYRVSIGVTISCIVGNLCHMLVYVKYMRSERKHMRSCQGAA